MEISGDRIKEFQEKIWRFYKKNKRPLPWRKTRDPYKIMLSELMLQQTQVRRVISYYETWIRKWPTIQDLAVASRHEVLQAWMGLGYNSRALHLHSAAQKIASDFHGDVLEAMRHYVQIPGVGRYTSQAVLIFSTNADLVTVDTNIRRILLHEFHLPEKSSEKTLWSLAQRCLPKGRSRDWHNALMDYGALHLTSTRTGIRPKTRQPKFEGSDRQLRARIIRMLLKKEEPLTVLEKTLCHDSSRLHQILDKLVDDEIIIVRNDCYSLKE